MARVAGHFPSSNKVKEIATTPSTRIIPFLNFALPNYSSILSFYSNCFYLLCYLVSFVFRFVSRTQVLYAKLLARTVRAQVAEDSAPSPPHINLPYSTFVPYPSLFSIPSRPQPPSTVLLLLAVVPLILPLQHYQQQ